VNVASKLGEDTAEAGEFLIDDGIMLHLAPSELQALKLAGALFTSRTIEISGVTIPAHRIDFSAMDLPAYFDDREIDVHTFSEFADAGFPATKFEEQMIARLHLNNESAAELDAFDQKWESAFSVSGTFFNSDMSGFTRLTKKFGILHFLGMIMKMRSMVRPIIESCGGAILHFDGDNVIAQFATPAGGAEAALRIQQTMHEYNSTTETDSRIILKIGLASGSVLNTGLQLFGDTWDLCEELGEELGQKRQVLMSDTVHAACNTSPFSSLIDSEVEEEHGGHRYTIVQFKKEADWIHAAVAPPNTWEDDVLECFERKNEVVTAQLRKKYETDGVALVIKLHSSLPEERDRLCVFSAIMQIIENLNLEGLVLIKRDEQRAFFFCTQPFAAVATALALMHLCLLVERAHRRYQVEATVGIARGSGKTLVFANDFYGDALNVASKLGEDTAEPGEILIDEVLFRELEESAIRLAQWTSAGMMFEERHIKISGVEIPARELICSKMDLAAFLSDVDVVIPSFSDFAPSGQSKFGKAMVERICQSDDNVTTDDLSLIKQIDDQVTADLTVRGTFFNSDMSGFTRLTKKFGILHFLGMIMKMRSIVKPLIEAVGGSVLHYDGDNVIARFDTAQAGATAAMRIQQALREYNGNKHMDHRIILKIGLASGQVLDTGLQLFGPTWDLCEELGEELGKKRQILMSKEVRHAADISEFAAIIGAETPATHDGDEYVIFDVLKETEWVFDSERDSVQDNKAQMLGSIQAHQVEKAAVAIQSTWRGHMVRKRMKDAQAQAKSPGAVGATQDGSADDAIDGEAALLHAAAAEVQAVYSNKSSRSLTTEK